MVRMGPVAAEKRRIAELVRKVLGILCDWTLRIPVSAVIL
jgi:hypothetical protein